MMKWETLLVRRIKYLMFEIRYVNVERRLWEYEIMVSITDGWNQNHSYF